MGQHDASSPPSIDVTTPSIARMYDYLLGGKDHFAADRAAAAALVDTVPDVARLARANRAFLGRAVRYLAEAGIRQFIDLGTGLPTQENVHQVAQRIAPDARVVYVDNDPIVLAHGRALLADTTTTIVIDADMREPQSILRDPDLKELVDLSRPVAVLFVSVLHFLTDTDNPAKIITAFRKAMASGSYLVLTHGTWGQRADVSAAAAAAYQASEVTLRAEEEIAAFFDGFDLVAPGLVDLQAWRPQDRGRERVSENGRLLAGVGRKP